MGKIDVQDVKEKIFLMGLTAGIFLPIRMIFVTYVTDGWLGSLGLLSIFALVFIYLAKKRKLGQLGRIFEKQMRKTIGGKIAKYIVAFSIVFLIFFGASIFSWTEEILSIITIKRSSLLHYKIINNSPGTIFQLKNFWDQFH